MNVEMEQFKLKISRKGSRSDGQVVWRRSGR